MPGQKRDEVYKSDVGTEFNYRITHHSIKYSCANKSVKLNTLSSSSVVLVLPCRRQKWHMASRIPINNSESSRVCLNSGDFKRIAINTHKYSGDVIAFLCLDFLTVYEKIFSGDNP